MLKQCNLLAICLLSSVAAYAMEESIYDKQGYKYQQNNDKYDESGKYEIFRFGTVEDIKNLLQSNPPREKTHHAGYIALNLMRNENVDYTSHSDRLISINKMVLSNKKHTNVEKMIVEIIDKVALKMRNVRFDGRAIGYKYFMCRCACDALKNKVLPDVFIFFVENTAIEITSDITKIVFGRPRPYWSYWITLPLQYFYKKEMDENELKKVAIPNSIFSLINQVPINDRDRARYEEFWHYYMSQNAQEAGNLEAYRIINNDANAQFPEDTNGDEGEVVLPYY